MLGDVIHNYRDCLDHVAWELYKRGRTPTRTETQEGFIYFPIALKKECFNASLKGDRAKLPGVRRSDVAVVRRYQPYMAGESRAQRHVFAVLDSLARADKHRTVQPVFAFPHRLTFLKLEFADCTLSRTFVLTPHWAGASDPRPELGRFYVRKTGPQPRVEMLPHFSLVPAINERLTVAEFLDRTMTATSSLLREFSEPPAFVLQRVATYAQATEVLAQRDRSRTNRGPAL